MDTNYAYGDNKSGEAANFGIFKQVGSCSPSRLLSS